MKRNWGLVLQVLELAERGELASFRKDTVEGFQYHVDLCKGQGLLDEDSRLTWPGHDELDDRRRRERIPIGFKSSDLGSESGRPVLTHRAPGLNEMLHVEALSEPGRGGANQVYRIGGHALQPTILRFQTGAVRDFGLNGLSNEALLAVVHDRLSGFQQGPFSCHDNDVALDGIETAIEAMRRRTMALQQAAAIGGGSTPPPNPAAPDPVAETGGPAGEATPAPAADQVKTPEPVPAPA